MNTVDAPDRRRRRVACIHDVRGRRVTCADPYELQLLRRWDVVPEDALAPIAAEIGFGLPKWQHRGYVACVLLFLMCVIFLVLWKLVRRAPIDTVEYVLWPVNLIVFALSATKFWQSGRRARAKRVCTVMLQHRRCPHCGYDIRGLPVDPLDGATVCPECGCAWRLTVARESRASFGCSEPDPANATLRHGDQRAPCSIGDEQHDE